MISSTNLLTIKSKQISHINFTNSAVQFPAPEKPQTTNSGLLNNYLNNMAMINAPAVQKVQKNENTAPDNYHNNLKTLFRNNEAKILMIIPRTFNAKDENGIFYRNSKVYRIITDKETKQEIKKELILNNHSKVMYDYDLIPVEEIRGNEDVK